MEIRPATFADWPSIWAILEPIIREGETLAVDRDADEQTGRDYWQAPGKQVFVALDPAGEIVGSYTLRANQAGPGAHVANAGYAVRGDQRGKGIAQRLCRHSLEMARAQGFRAMQFNFVISTNVRAVRLWQHMGFAIIGTLPGAFRHPKLGYVDAYVMYRSLAGEA
ncbi:GNAT family N-acetyltransferase [Sphingobium nicotianae]|uniref:GNAT family N-acetyltransferase n=1 Tax=Sphingobium nicotianae TaxID=2782607 RepID=A0A9X1DFL9_9SPHN|nr:GNAT family N-acetyltransferase [Sphingobium nicotianae]MBT2189370.1 GNAT family N-acetyltransferase [Sphingobium nicotianae]